MYPNKPWGVIAGIYRTWILCDNQWWMGSCWRWHDSRQYMTLTSVSYKVAAYEMKRRGIIIKDLGKEVTTNDERNVADTQSDGYEITDEPEVSNQPLVFNQNVQVESLQQRISKCPKPGKKELGDDENDDENDENDDEKDENDLTIMTSGKYKKRNNSESRPEPFHDPRRCRDDNCNKCGAPRKSNIISRQVKNKFGNFKQSFGNVINSNTVSKATGKQQQSPFQKYHCQQRQTLAQGVRVRGSKSQTSKNHGKSKHKTKTKSRHAQKQAPSKTSVKKQVKTQDNEKSTNNGASKLIMRFDTSVENARKKRRVM